MPFVAFAPGVGDGLLGLRRVIALTVGSVAPRGLTTLDGGHSIQGFGDLRDAITQTAAITLGLIVGAVPVQAAAVRRRRLAAGKSLAT
jgi:hypothetical protein